MFERNGLNMEGWRFPGFSFRNNQINILKELNLFDSSVRDKSKKWGRLLFIRNWLANIKRMNLFVPSLITRVTERTWSYADLNDDLFYQKKGRLVMHCYTYHKFKDSLEIYLGEMISNDK